MKDHRENALLQAAEAGSADPGSGKLPYEKPRVVFTDTLEFVASSCTVTSPDTAGDPSCGVGKDSVTSCQFNLS
jgi:hypothetical protein